MVSGYLIFILMENTSFLFISHKKEGPAKYATVDKLQN